MEAGVRYTNSVIFIVEKNSSGMVETPDVQKMS